MNSLSKSARARRFLAGAIAFVIAGAASAQTPTRLDVDAAAVHAQYGRYANVAINLKDAYGNISGIVQWKILADSVPAGMQFSPTVGSLAQILGTPAFTGSWCFVVGATDDRGRKAQSRVCLDAQDNPALRYPKFVVDRYLPDATINQSYRAVIKVDPASVTAFTGSLTGAAMPLGMQIAVEPLQSQFTVSGLLRTPQIFQFALQMRDTRTGVVNSRQFQLSFNNPAPVTPSCPAGYYYDAQLGYCVQDQLNQCPAGWFYDPEYRNCIQYPAPPTTISCRSGYHFDPYLSTCVRDSEPRCPLNYRWDESYDRCVREPTSCPIGYQYSWSSRECERVWDRDCSINEHYDPVRHRCEADYRDCRAGEVWDPSSRSCVRNHRDCRVGEYWDPSGNCCVPDRPVCGPGAYYDPRTGRCVSNQPHDPYPYPIPTHTVPGGGPVQPPRPQPTFPPRPIPTHTVPGGGPVQPPRPEPTREPRPEPTREPRPEPTREPRPEPTREPRPEPTREPRPRPPLEPRPEPTREPRPEPSGEPHPHPTHDVPGGGPGRPGGPRRP